MNDIVINKVNESFISINCNPGILQELSDHFSFMTPNAKYDPRVRRKLWDGKIRLLKKDRQLLSGLKDDVVRFAYDNNYTVVDNFTITNHKKVTYQEIEEWAKSLNLTRKGKPLEAREYQLQAVVEVINNNNKGIITCPTNGGKSLICYLLARWYNQKMLIVVPTIQLVGQMSKDFTDYGYSENVHEILAGADKTINEMVTVSTWQSIYELPLAWFSRFKVLVQDECHGTKHAKSIQAISEKALNAYVRVGMTGTLGEDDTGNNFMTVRGQFGNIITTTTTRELIDAGHSADLDITAIELDYPEEIRKACKKHKPDYPAEINILTGSTKTDTPGYLKRTKFVAKLAAGLKGNSLIMFRYIRHGKELQEEIQKLLPDRKVYLVNGKTDKEDREQIRTLMEQGDNVIAVVSYKTTATGVSITRLNNLVFAAPIKAQILVLQAIGRALRVGEDKVSANVYDIGDNLSYGKYQNHAYRHFINRMEYYTKEQLNFKIVKVKV